MSQHSGYPPYTDAPSRDSVRAAMLRRLGRPRFSGRSGRVILLVVFLLMANAFDLAFTILAHRIGGFEEVNPVARQLLDNTGALIAFKSGAVVLACAIFVLFRHRRLTELVCWLFAVGYTLLSFIWMAYYSHLAGQ